MLSSDNTPVGLFTFTSIYATAGYDDRGVYPSILACDTTEGRNLAESKNVSLIAKLALIAL